MMRDITASWFSEVCHGVTIERHSSRSQERSCLTALQSLMKESARLDVVMYGFWESRFEKAFLDVRVFNPCTQSNRWSPLTSVYRQKRQQYEQRVREVAHATFIPRHVRYWRYG